MDNYILFIILLLLIVTSLCYLNMHNDIIYALDYLSTGSDPLTFYQLIYRNL